MNLNCFNKHLYICRTYLTIDISLLGIPNFYLVEKLIYFNECKYIFLDDLISFITINYIL